MPDENQNAKTYNSGSLRSSIQRLWAGVLLFLVWTGTTYLLEGRNLTFIRPEAVADRLVYTAGVNVLVGIISTIIALHYFIQKFNVEQKRFDFKSTRRTKRFHNSVLNTSCLLSNNRCTMISLQYSISTHF